MAKTFCGMGHGSVGTVAAPGQTGPPPACSPAFLQGFFETGATARSGLGSCTWPQPALPIQAVQIGGSLPSTHGVRGSALPVCLRGRNCSVGMLRIHYS